MNQKLLASAVAVLLGCTVQGRAQNPSTEDMIRALRPPDTNGTRGIRELGPAERTTVAPLGATSEAVVGAAMTVAPRRSTPAPGHPAAAQGAPHAVNVPNAVNLTVNFGSGSTELTPSALRTLDDLGRALTSSSLASFRFRIEGHTDTVGTPEMNKALSERRAASVLDYLVRRWGVDRARLESAGLGQEHLLVPTGQNVAEPTNRRVTVVNLGA